MAGMCYGIGVGPGEPDLMTLKAVQTIRLCDLILVPGSVYETSAAYRIAVQAVPEIKEKEIQAVEMLMTREPDKLERSHKEAVERIVKWLGDGRIIGFLNLGDITLYSTYLYLHHRILAAGFRSELINGIPSFCAAAARLNIGLANGEEPVHIVPVPWQVKEGLSQPGTKIMMKMGSSIEAVRSQVQEQGRQGYLVENCGMPGERVYRSIEEIPHDVGYYSVMIVKE